LALGLIDGEQFAAINATNTLLERQAEEYEKAVVDGGDVDALQAIHNREIREAETKEVAAGLNQKIDT
jgi:hypothetical protein